MNIFCEKPAIIFNEKFKWNVLARGFYYRDGRLITLPVSKMEYYWYKFPYYVFTKKYCRVEKGSLDFVYTIDDFGEIVPAYIEVPCGKCPLCRDSKTREWRIRAVAETQTSMSIPIFVTLTYKEVPEKGVSKEELQKFMKRVRIALDRQGIEHSIRYFACGEYGSLTGRPHYHLILWNWPVDNEAVKCGIPLDIQADRVLRPNWKYGFIMTRACNVGSISYVMKYMRKGVQSPKGMNKGFFLSSRKKGGLGIEWLRQNLEYFRRNPHVLTMTVTDKYTGKSFESVLPRYFKDKVFPPHSKAIPKKVNDALNTLNCACLYRRALDEVRMSAYELCDVHWRDALDVFCPIYAERQLAVFKKFEKVFRFHEFRQVPQSMKIGILHDSRFVPIEDLVQQTDIIIQILTDYLNEVLFDDGKFGYLQSLKEIQLDRMSLVYGEKTFTDEEIRYAVGQSLKRVRANELKETI